VIDLLSWAIMESGGSFLLVLGPSFSVLLTNSALLAFDERCRYNRIGITVGIRIY
jgi:hypothetical protein